MTSCNRHSRWFCFLLLVLQGYVMMAQNQAVSSASPFEDNIRFYQKFISAIRLNECAMYPSCSRYGQTALRDKGAIIGLVYTTDRLLRCGHEHALYTKVNTGTGTQKLEDPVVGKSNFLPIRYTAHYSYLLTKRKDKDSLSFITHLINNKHYREALVELRRLLFTSAASTEPILAKVYANAGTCLMALEEEEEFIFMYERQMPEWVKQDNDVLLLVARAYHQVQNMQAAETILSQLQKAADEPIQHKALLMLAFGYARQHEWKMADSVYKTFGQQSSYQATVQNNLKITSMALKLKPRKAWVATLLGMAVPGAGYAYAGHTSTGLSALVLNGLLGYATYTSVQTGNTGMAILTGTFGAAFYIGNIFGGSRAVHRYNVGRKNIFARQIQLYY